MDNCRICNSTEMTPILSGLQTRQGEVYGLVQCNACAFTSTHPLPGPNQLKQYYDQDYWQNSGGKSGGLLDTFYKLRMNGIIKTIKKMVPAGSRVLDWGAGDGSLLRLLEAEGFEVAGIDIYSAECLNRKLINASIKNAPFQNEFFDAITCFHVLEHLADPLNSLKHALKLLNPGGLIVIEVPNLNSLGFQIFKRRWQPLEIPTHLNHFTPATLYRLFDAAGRTRIVRTDFFSHRISPSALVLSAFGSLSPRRTRKKYRGRYPLPLLGLYLILQFMAYPLAVAGSLMGRGEIVRMYVRETG